MRRHRVRLASSLALGLLLAGCQTAPAPMADPDGPALAAQVYQFKSVELRIPSEFTGTSCDGQPLTGSGYVSLNYHFLLDAQGQSHVEGIVIWSGIKGQDASGTRYTGNGTSQSINEFSAGAANVVNGTYHFNFISAGAAGNPVVYADFHTTITPDGEIATTFDNFRTECRG